MSIGYFELVDAQTQLLGEIAMPELKQKDIALTYALAFRTHDTVDWRVVNEAIIARWSVSGLQRIKTMAWKLHDEWIANQETKNEQ